MIKNYFFSFILLFSFINFSSQAQTKDIKALLKRGRLYKSSQPELALKNLNDCYKHAIHQRDTTIAIESLLELGDLYSHSVDYSKSYDSYWKALLLTELSNDEFYKAKTYQGLGWLYSFYKRDKEALKYFKLSLKINKRLYKKNKSMIAYIGSDYFSYANFYRTRKNNPLFETYLDSLIDTDKNGLVKETNYYLETEVAYKLSNKGKYKEALEKLEKSKLFFTNKYPPYLVIVNHLIGDTYQKMGAYKKSKKAFLESIEASKNSNSHLNYNIYSYEALVEIAKIENNYKEAFEYKSLATELNDQVFGSKSLSNQNLFELKDTYRITKEKEAILKKEERLKQLEQEEYIWFLKYVILIGSIVFMIIFGIFFIKQLRIKHATEKKVLKERQQQELKRQSEIIELKNQELTSQALQLIEKEEFLSNLSIKLSKQKENIDTKLVDRVLKSIQGNPTSNWKEFEARFTQINQSFYKNLKAKFPDLGPTDQKVCALIKLNFSSKDMASLLGISVESVHTSRYRLRKKLGLKRNENLAAFINSL